MRAATKQWKSRALGLLCLVLCLGLVACKGDDKEAAPADGPAGKVTELEGKVTAAGKVLGARQLAMGSVVHARSDPTVVAAVSLETLGMYTEERGSQSYPFPLSVFYPNTGNFVTFVGNVRSRRLVRRMGRTFRESEDFPTRGGSGPGWITGLGWSDHWAYWKEGVPAVMVTDTALFRNPHYHERSDTPETLDPVAIARVVRGMTEVVKTLADD